MGKNRSMRVSTENVNLEVDSSFLELLHERLHSLELEPQTFLSIVICNK